MVERETIGYKTTSIHWDAMSNESILEFTLLSVHLVCQRGRSDGHIHGNRGSSTATFAKHVQIELNTHPKRANLSLTPIQNCWADTRVKPKLVQLYF